MARNTVGERIERNKRIVEAVGGYPALGRKIGVSPQAIYAIITERARGATGRYAVAAALGVSVDDLWPTEAPPEKVAA